MTLPDRESRIGPDRSSRNTRTSARAAIGCLDTAHNDAADIYARGRRDSIIGNGDVWGSRVSEGGGRAFPGNERGGDGRKCSQGANDGWKSLPIQRDRVVNESAPREKKSFRTPSDQMR